MLKLWENTKKDTSITYYFLARKMFDNAKHVFFFSDFTTFSVSSKTEINKICTRNLLTLHIYNFYDYFVQMVEGCGRILRTFRRMAKFYFRMEFVRVLKSFKKKMLKSKVFIRKENISSKF